MVRVGVIRGQASAQSARARLESAMRCTCGEHELGEGPFEACHGCGGPTKDVPSLLWMGGKCFVGMPMCHVCMVVEDMPKLIPLALAPPDLVKRAVVDDSILKTSYVPPTPG